MLKITKFVTILMIMSQTAVASEMTFGFKNPQFSGDGFSSHVLTIENEEYTRRQAREAAKKAAADAATASANNTNLSKFLNNLESRIYAQLSLQLSNAMFSDGSTTGTMQFEGSTISWIKDSTAQTIALTVIDATGNRTDITVPIGSFKF
jgi:Type VIII secretion system (T8SS), CsgF protein